MQIPIIDIKIISSCITRIYNHPLLPVITPIIKEILNRLIPILYSCVLDLRLEQTEMGIYGLISANGLSEYITGKDMFDNKLTDEQRQASITQSMIGAIPFVPYAPGVIKEAVRISEIPVHKTYQLVQTGLSKSQLIYKGFLTNIYQPNSQLSPLGPSMAMFKSDNVNNNVKKVSNHSVKSTSRVNTTKKTAGNSEVKYDFSQYEKKLVGITWVLSKNGRTDQDAAKASLAYNEAIKKGEVKLDNEPDSDIYLEQIQAAKEGYNLWTGEELSKLESNSINFSSLIGSVYGFRGGKTSGRSIKVSKGDLGKIREKVKGNKANTEVTKGTGNSIQYAETGGRNISPEQFFKEEAIAEEMYEKFRNLGTEDVNAIAKNTGFSVARIQRIKDHVFNNSHKKDYGVGRFDPDYELAQAWQRLIDGKQVDSDIQLLHHEIFESKFEGIFQTNYRTAHDKTIESGRPWNWEKNYEE